MQLLVRVGVVLANRSTPVVVMTSDHLWPLGSILSFPTGVAGMYNNIQSNFNIYTCMNYCMQELWVDPAGHSCAHSQLTVLFMLFLVCLKQK